MKDTLCSPNFWHRMRTITLLPTPCTIEMQARLAQPEGEFLLFDILQYFHTVSLGWADKLLP